MTHASLDAFDPGDCHYDFFKQRFQQKRFQNKLFKMEDDNCRWIQFNRFRFKDKPTKSSITYIKYYLKLILQFVDFKIKIDLVENKWMTWPAWSYIIIG